MLISIIIPCFNSQNYLVKSLDSLLLIKKGKINLEIILVNDGSRDSTETIIRKYALTNDFIKFINQKNAGVSNARNNGLKIASGEYILFLDSDDQYRTNIINELAFFINKIDFDILEFDFSFINKKNSENVISNKNPVSGFFHYMSFSQINSASNKLYKREFLINNKIVFDESYSIGEDLLFNLEAMSLAKKVISTNMKLLVINDNNINSVTRKKNKKQKALIIDSLMRIYKIISNHHIYSNDALKKRFYFRHSKRLFKSLIFKTLLSALTLKSSIKNLKFFFQISIIQLRMLFR